MAMFTTRERCPGCNMKDQLYIRRTSPALQLGCRRCEKRVKELREKGLTDTEIKKILNIR